MLHEAGNDCFICGYIQTSESEQGVSTKIGNKKMQAIFKFNTSDPGQEEEYKIYQNAPKYHSMILEISHVLRDLRKGYLKFDDDSLERLVNIISGWDNN